MRYYEDDDDDDPTFDDLWITGLLTLFLTGVVCVAVLVMVTYPVASGLFVGIAVTVITVPYAVGVGLHRLSNDE